MAPRRLAALAVAAGLAAAACQVDRPSSFRLREPVAPPRDSPTLSVGFVGTLSGPDAWRGEDAFEGADLGVHHLNRRRPRGTPSYELVQLDDGGDPGRAAELVERLARLRTTVGIVYAGPPEGLSAAAPALERAGIPALLCYGDPGGGDTSHVFTIGPPAALQARRLVAYLVGDRGYATVGALVERSRAGEVALEALRAAAGRRARVAGVRLASSRSRLRPAL
ncbi:MAG TPA: ABC transporter substrate-binding protein, partial [Actinomycetota bacterium]|nr:ABC transporter substrate-binding protein [Actinomycetota bacterium]